MAAGHCKRRFTLVQEMRATWDGQEISSEPPFGASVVVFRAAESGADVLLLHRGHHGAEYAGDWAWTPPAGARFPGEPIAVCAARELREETGLSLPFVSTECGTAEWPVYLAQAPRDASVILDAEHDRFEWVAGGQAAARCMPETVARALDEAVQLIWSTLSGGIRR